MHKGAVAKELAKYDIKKMMKAYYNQVKKNYWRTYDKIIVR